MNRCFAVILFVACIFTANALDITTRTGSRYKNAKVTAVEPDGLRIQHDDGVAKIPFENLSKELQNQYHFDADKVAAYRQSAAEAKTLAEAKMAETRDAKERSIKKGAKIEKPPEEPASVIGEPTESQKATTRSKAGWTLLLYLSISLAVAAYFGFRGNREVAILISVLWFVAIVSIGLNKAWHVFKDAYGTAKNDRESKERSDRNERRWQEELRRNK